MCMFDQHCQSASKYRVIPDSVGNQLPRNSKRRQSPKSPLHKQVEPTINPSATPWLAGVHVSVEEQGTAQNPQASQSSRQLRVLQSSRQDEEHSLARVLKEVGVSALCAVKLFGFGLYDWQC